MLGEAVRDLRHARGWTQVELATRAGVSRQLVGAVEAGRHLPRVDAALALARALDVAVEQLLAPPARASVTGVLETPRDGQPVRVARVGDTLVCVPAAPAGESWAPADAVVRDGQVDLLEAERPAAAVAGCDPAIGLAARLLEVDAGTGALVASTSSTNAVAALAAGRVHAAFVHGRHGTLPPPPVPVRRWEVARWQVGLAAPDDLPTGWVADALAGRLAVVQREDGAGSQAAFERAVAAAATASGTAPDLPADGPRASGHLEAASWARRSGCAAVSMEPAALALGLGFHPLEEHVSELWVAVDHLDAVGVRRFLDEVTGARLRRRLTTIGGYDLTRCGTEVAA
jgi:transcriptional regulator with XRE-family HTH domain/molybdate-binding protein